jgi:hypothetical protein
MDYQGARRTRSATGARHQASWSSDDPGYEPDPGQGTAPRHAISPGSGAQQLLGSGPQQVMGPGSGAQAALGRTPVRGFPPVNPAPPGAPEPPQEAFGPWRTPDAGEDEMTPVTRRHGARTVASKTAAPRTRGRAAWLALATVAVIAAGGFVGYKYFYEPRVNAPVPSTLRLPTNAPGSPSFDKALGTWQHIGTRAEDPAPLTLTGLYPPRFTLNGASYTRTAASVTKDCTLAVYGSQLQAALQSGHCTQLLRASYISGDGTMMGTVGVANLSTSGAAEAAGHATGPQQILAPLSSQKGPTSKLGTGTGVVQAEIKGHYLILMWAEFTSLKSPSTSAQRQALEQFAANLVTGSANINLSTRMVGTK